MEKENLSDLVMDKIKEDHIAPKPRWRFLAKDYMVWALGALSWLVGAAATSVAIYLLANNDWQVYGRFSDSFWHFLLLSLPYFWLAMLALFVLAVYYNIKHTKKGYRYSWITVALSSVCLSLVGGGILFAAGAGQAIDDVLGEKVDAYHHFINPRHGIWNSPAAGFLAGLVISRDSDHECMLLDIRRQEWLVKCYPPCEAGLLHPGRPAKVIGRSENGVFIAEQVFPMGPGRGQFMRPHFQERFRLESFRGRD